MKLRLELSGSIAAAMQAELDAGEKAVSDAVRGATLRLKADWRGQIAQAGLGQRLGRTIRSEAYPKGQPSLNAAALVWSNAPVIVGAHDSGPLIRSKSGLWLAIPTAAAGKSTRGGRITPAEWERRRGLSLRFIYRARGPSLLVAEGRLNSRGLGVAEIRQGADHCADLSVGAAGEAGQAAGFGESCRSSGRADFGGDCGELGGK